MPSAKYTEKLQVVDALQFTGNNRQEMIAFCPDIVSVMDEELGRLRLYFMRMEMLATDWSVKLPIGSFQMWNDAQFHALYAASVP